MKFEIGKFYQNNNKRVRYIIGEVQTTFHGKSLLAEDDHAHLLPIEADEVNVENWKEVKDWGDDFYKKNPSVDRKNNPLGH